MAGENEDGSTRTSSKRTFDTYTLRNTVEFLARTGIMLSNIANSKDLPPPSNEATEMTCCATILLLPRSTPESVTQLSRLTKQSRTASLTKKRSRRPISLYAASRSFLAPSPSSMSSSSSSSSSSPPGDPNNGNRPTTIPSSVNTENSLSAPLLPEASFAIEGQVDEMLIFRASPEYSTRIASGLLSIASSLLTGMSSSTFTGASPATMSIPSSDLIGAPSSLLTGGSSLDDSTTTSRAEGSSLAKAHVLELFASL